MKHCALVVAVVAFACSLGSAGASTSRVEPLAKSRTAVVPDSGCTNTLPRLWTVRADWRSLVSVCGSAGGSSVAVTNIGGSVVVRVSKVFPPGNFTQFVSRDNAPNLEALTTGRIVGAMCVRSAYCIPPGRTYTITREFASIDSIDFQIAYKTSFAARAGATLAGMLDFRKRFVPASITSIVGCAKSVGTLADPSQDLTFADTALTAISGYKDCTSVAKLFDDTNQAERETLAQKTVALADRFGGPLFEDFIKLEALKLFRL